jgi:hypothetical protein
MKYSRDSTIRDILETEKGRLILEKNLPAEVLHANLAMESDRDLKSMVSVDCIGLSQKIMEQLVEDLNRPIAEVIPDINVARKSLDEIDNESFKAASSPFWSKAEEVCLLRGDIHQPNVQNVICLDGERM